MINATPARQAQLRSPDRPRVAVLFTGGTISMITDHTAGGNIPALDGASIIARTPGLADVAEVVAIDVDRAPGSQLTLPQILEIGRVVAGQLTDPTIDGVVVVQGTDTIEETSFFWDLMLDTSKPVIVTGAMRSASEPGDDGPANLCDAVRAASSPALRGQGVVVVLGGSIEAADDVVKMHASSVSAFASPNAGSLGRVDGDRLTVFRRRLGWRRVNADRVATRVHLITAVAGMDASLLEAAIGAGADGIVVAGTGMGNTPAQLLLAARPAIDAGIPVALTTRCSAGCAGFGYAYPGAAAAWLNAGALLAGHLSGPKTRIALALGVGAGLDHQDLATLLAGPQPARALE